MCKEKYGENWGYSGFCKEFIVLLWEFLYRVSTTEKDTAGVLTVIQWILDFILKAMGAIGGL